MFIHVSLSETLPIDARDSVLGRDKMFSNHPIRIENKIKKAAANKPPVIQNALRLKNGMGVHFQRYQKNSS